MEDRTSDIIATAIEAYQTGEWALVAAGAIMVAVWVTRAFILKRIPSNALPWVAGAIGMATSVATELSEGENIYKAVVHGLLVGQAATGMWSMLGKHVLPKQVGTKTDQTE
jgi:hypothetical protein